MFHSSRICPAWDPAVCTGLSPESSCKEDEARFIIQPLNQREHSAQNPSLRSEGSFVFCWQDPFLART